jgi:hypothetical protein
MLGLSRDELVKTLDALTQRHRRVWLVRADGGDAVSKALVEHAFLADDLAFANPRTVTNVSLLLPQTPVRDRLPEAIQHPTGVVFGDQVRLIGYDVGQSLAPELAMPVTLYWQPVAPLTRRYKYILRLVSEEGDMLATTETEPYSGFLPTTTWPVGRTIVEYTGVPVSAKVAPGKTRLTLQVYDAETLQKLPVTQSTGIETGRDQETVILAAQP